MSEHLDLLAVIWTAQSALALVVGAVVMWWYARNFLSARKLQAETIATVWLMALGSIVGLLGANGLFFGNGLLSLFLDPTDETRIFWSRVMIICAQAVLIAVLMWKFVMTIKLDSQLREGEE